MQPSFRGLIQKTKSNSFIGPKEDFSPLPIKRYILSGKYEGIVLPKREADTLGYLAQGNSIKEIAKLMQLSPRTVRYYIDNAKNRLKTTRKSELIKIALNLPII